MGQLTLPLNLIIQVLFMKYSLCFTSLLFFYSTFSQELVNKRNIIYATAPNWQNRFEELKLDIVYPSKKKKLPIIIYLHGGGFLEGSKEPDSSFCQRLAKSGFFVANIEYRRGFNRSPQNFRAGIIQAIYRAQQDAAAALRYLVHNTTVYPMDTSLILIAGASAGGVTSLFMGYINQKDWNTLAAPTISSLGAIDSSGNDLNDKFKIRGVINLWGGINDTSLISQQEMRTVPVLLFHSLNDEVIPYERSSHPEAEQQLLHGSFDIAHRFKNNNACYKLYFVKGAKHDHGFSQNYIIKAISDFVNNIRQGKCKSGEIENRNAELSWSFWEYVDTWDKDQSKWSSLMKFAHKGDTSGIKSLLIRGQDVNGKNVDGWTALKVAVKKGQITTVKYLLRYTADPNLADTGGLNSLMEACLHNNYDIAAVLLETGADPNLTNIYGWTALMGATTHGDIKLMELLLNHQADVNAKRKTDGMTALRLAKIFKDNKKIELLTSYGAK